MKILIVYDTTSAKRNTEKVAQAISEVFKTKGFEVDCLYVNDAAPAKVKNCDSVLAGSPPCIQGNSTDHTVSGQIHRKRVCWKTGRSLRHTAPEQIERKRGQGNREETPETRLQNSHAPLWSPT